MPIIDLFFPVLGTILPTDHAYQLYAALSEAVPAFHQADANLRFAAISGQYVGNGLLQLNEHSGLRCRLPSDRIGLILPLAGRKLVVGEHRIRLGVPRVFSLQPTPALLARVVTIKHATEPDRFLEVVRQQLDALGVRGEPGIPLISGGQRQGQPRRQVLRIKGKRVVGFALAVAGLTAEESLKLQENGLGGRKRLGCGFFLPVSEEVPS